MKPVNFYLPLKTQTESNTGGNWRPKARRAKKQRGVANYVAGLMLPPKVEFPIVVHMERVGVRKLDSDNLHSSMKHIRDGIAQALGVDDGRDDLVTWECSQRTGTPIGVNVEVRSK